MQGQKQRMSRFYKLHAGIYQATRWSFLFGRSAVLKQLNLEKNTQLHLLEIGSGTGHNLTWLAARYPNLQLTGIDASPEMLSVAGKRTAQYGERIRLIEQVYGHETTEPLPQRPDIILISYCLTMINPGWESVVQQALSDVKPEGRIVVVDFHDSPLELFRRWMRFNHVRMQAHILPLLDANLNTINMSVKPAYWGLWRYFGYIGRKVA